MITMDACCSSSSTRGRLPQTFAGRIARRCGGLGEVYKQLNAPFGQFGMDTLAMSTQAIKSGSSNDDSTYTVHENKLSAFYASARTRWAGQDAVYVWRRRLLMDKAIQKGQALLLIFPSGAIAAPDASRPRTPLR